MPLRNSKKSILRRGVWILRVFMKVTTLLRGMVQPSSSSAWIISVAVMALSTWKRSKTSFTSARRATDRIDSSASLLVFLSFFP